MSAPDAVIQLVERFDRNAEAYRSGQYNETQLRREFLDPLFKALGWDIDNERGYGEAYKDVVHEDAIRVQGAPRAPDYCFRVGGTRKFFLEAKKPAVRVKDDIGPAYQVRRYGWSAKLPLSVLSDFEEFAVYDCRQKPQRGEKASVARVKYLTYAAYADEWDWLEGTFSKEAILQGAFDKWADSTGGKRGTAEVDDAFLAEIESWREDLAKNIAIRNPGLSTLELNFAVQRTIDRLVFLRICEDRGIEDYGRLQALLNGAEVYARLAKLFHDADERYNSGLFYFRSEKGRGAPDELTLSLKVDDAKLKGILKRLYYPDSPYEFSVLPADILGQVYERFLGKVIRLTAGHQAKVEEKPEVRKAGGVYYTPTYIVDYIVEHTVGELLKGKTPDEIGGKTPLRVLDPACGSGSFLIGAYQYLLDWYLRYYTEHDPEKLAKRKQPPIGPGPGGDWRLTTAERKRILTTHIFGVDIDGQAVEVTKLSLLLKVLEGETNQSLQSQLTLFRERALPDLAENIKCGNSLIGPDYYDDKPADLFDEEEARRVNVFDWNAEFPDAMKAGGFDAVIGNPPYGAAFTDGEKGYIRSAFRSYGHRFDSYVYFLERGLLLTRSGGHLAFITPELWLRLEGCASLRQLLLTAGELRTLLICGEGVFSAAVVNTVVSVLRRGGPSGAIRVEQGDDIWAVPEDAWRASAGWAVEYRLRPGTVDLVSAVRTRGSAALGEYGDLTQGITPYDRYRGQDPALIRARAFHHAEARDQTCGRWLAGKDVARYAVSWSGEWLSYGPWLAAPREPRFFEGPRLLFREVPGAAKRIQATFVGDTYYHGHSITPFKPNSTGSTSALYLLGLVNSRLISWLGALVLPNFGKDVFPKLNPQDVRSLPIRPIDFENPDDVAKHDRMVSLVETMLDLNKRLPEAKTPDERTRLERRIASTDRQIDLLVYDLYGLTDEEIAIVEADGA